MEKDLKNFKISNLNIPGIDKSLFLNDEFYKTPCKKPGFNGVIKEYEFKAKNQTDYISMAPKFIPHSDYELMLQSTDSIIKSSILTLTDEAVSHIFNVGYRFIEFLSTPGIINKYGLINGYPYLVYNYDEFTTDRHSGMSKKDFHLHLNSWTEDTLQNISSINRNDISSFYYRSIIDPIFDITQTLVRDALDSEELRKYIRLAEPVCGDQNIEYSAVYEIKNGWKSLQGLEFVELLKTIHRKLEIRYAEILQCFCGTTELPALYSRHSLLPQDMIRNNIYTSKLQDATKDILLKRIDKIKSISPEQFQRISQKPNFRDSIISLRWLAYSIGFFSNSYINSQLADQTLYMNITPRLFTKIGGASLMNFPEHALVKIDRGMGNISRDEFDKRSEFHKEFSRSIGRNL